MNLPQAPAPVARVPVDFIGDVASGRVELPVIPRVVQNLIFALRRQDVAYHEIVGELAQDPVLSAKVLRLANSSYFGGRGSLASIEAAVSMVGIRALTTLIVACGVSAAFIEVPGVNLRQFWSDSLVTATAASRLAAQLEAEADSAYVCGLLHTTGHLILCKAYPKLAAGQFADFAVRRGAELAARERAAFGIAHPDVGCLWAERLGFPDPVAHAIRTAALPPTDADTPLDTVLRSASALASAVSRGDDAEAALADLAEAARARFATEEGAPGAEFVRIHAALQRVESTL